MRRKFFQKLLKTTLLAAFPILLAALLGKIWHTATFGFKMQKIAPESYLSSTWQKNLSVLPEEEKEKISAILDQPYYFLGRGQQAYAFESRDGLYVIKFIRMPKYSPPFWTRLPYLPQGFIKKGIKVSNRRTSFWRSCKKSVQIAERELKEETGLIFCHLEQTDDIKKFIKVYDRLKVGHVVDLDRYAFILQKKMQMIAPYLLELHKENNREGIEKALSSFVETVTDRAQKKIRNKNRNCMRNLGIFDGKVREFDVGELRLQPEMDQKLEIQKSTYQFKKWLQENMPSYVPYFEKLL